MSEMAGVVGRARAIADEVLFPRALEVDGADAVPLEHLDLLAREGFYGLVGPPEHGGMGADFPTMCAVVEALASGCLTTAFVWVQHLGALWRTAACGNASLRDEWLRPMCAGERRAGIALAALRPGPPRLVARPVEGGWVFDGSAPWVTGWGRIDATLTAAMTEDGRVVRALVDARDGAYPRESAEAREGATISARRLRVVAANASGTV